MHSVLFCKQSIHPSLFTRPSFREQEELRLPNGSPQVDSALIQSLCSPRGRSVPFQFSGFHSEVHPPVLSSQPPPARARESHSPSSPKKVRGPLLFPQPQNRLPPQEPKACGEAVQDFLIRAAGSFLFHDKPTAAWLSRWPLDHFLLHDSFRRHGLLFRISCLVNRHFLL